MKKPSIADLRHLTVSEYLNSTQTEPVQPPQPVHSTIGANFFEIIQSGHLKADDCKVFKGERLTYLFVGRPSYKKPGKVKVSEWMLPVVFVLRSLDGLPIKRIYPIDTGAFAAHRLPDYLTAFDREMFFLGVEPEQVGRVIGSFYETVNRFMRGASLSIEEIKKQVEISIRHAAIQALVRLYGETSNPKVDDRARNIEIQVGADIPLSGNLIGVVAPDAYRMEGAVEEHFKAMGAVVEFYNVHPLNPDGHFGQVYDAVQRIMRGGV